MGSKAITTWQKIFDRHVVALKTEGEKMPATELKLHLKGMIDLIGLRWSIHTTMTLKKYEDSSLYGLGLGHFVPHAAVSDEPIQRKPIPLPREGGEECLWWDRKTRYQEFDGYAKGVILQAADDQRLRSPLDEDSADLAYCKALAKMADKKVSWKKLPELGTEKGFAAAVLSILDPEATLEAEDKRSGGLSHLLARLEKALHLI